MTYKKILEKIELMIPNPETFMKNVKKHIQHEYFPLIYQCLYERIMPKGCHKFSTEKFKKLLKNDYLRLINDIYRTRLSNKAFPDILKRLQSVQSFDRYEDVLKIFENCNPRNHKRINAFSFGTKVLHTYNPEENPMLDSVVRKNLRINNEMSIDLCLYFKKAISEFSDRHKDYFSNENIKVLKEEFAAFNLKPNFPKMKMLDMALYQTDNLKKGNLNFS